MRILIVVDGSNAYHRMRELGVNLDYGQLVNNLASKDDIADKWYYVGIVRAHSNDAPAAIALMASQQRFLAHLVNPGWVIKEGYLLKHNAGYSEKGVDVKMALDIALGAVRDEYDKCVLLSSDTDLLPAIEIAQAAGKQIEYIGFVHRPSYALMRQAGSYRLLGRDDL